MKILIIGASGLVGSYLFNQFSSCETVRGTSFPESEDSYSLLDIRDREALERQFTNFLPEVVLLSAAVSNVEYCEVHELESRKVNIEGTKNVIEEIKKIKARFVFFSSEYVFDGTGGPYSEEDLPNPINEYGKQKLEAENMIKQGLDDFLIIRTTVVYGKEKAGKNFVAQLLHKLRQGKSMQVATDQISSPTYGNNLALAVRELIQKNKQGVYNIVGSKTMSRYDFALIVCKVFGLDDNLIQPVVTSRLGQRARRPLRAGLKIDKARKELETCLFSPEEGLLRMSEECRG